MSFPRTPSCFCGGAFWKHFSTLWGLSIAPMEKDIIEHHLFTLNLWVIFVIFSVWTRAKWSQRFCVNCSIFYLEIAYIVVTLFMKWWCYTWSNPEQDHYWLCLYGRLYLSFQHFPWVQHTHTHTRTPVAVLRKSFSLEREGGLQPQWEGCLWVLDLIQFVTELTSGGCWTEVIQGKES